MENSVLNSTACTVRPAPPPLNGSEKLPRFRGLCQLCRKPPDARSRPAVLARNKSSAVKKTGSKRFFERSGPPPEQEEWRTTGNRPLHHRRHIRRAAQLRGTCTKYSICRSSRWSRAGTRASGFAAPACRNRRIPLLHGRIPGALPGDPEHGLVDRFRNRSGNYLFVMALRAGRVCAPLFRHGGDDHRTDHARKVSGGAFTPPGFRRNP